MPGNQGNCDCSPKKSRPGTKTATPPPKPPPKARKAKKAPVKKAHPGKGTPCNCASGHATKAKAAARKIRRR